MLAQAMWGVMKRRLLSLMDRSGEFSCMGSSQRTSSPAAAILCSVSASARSCSDTIAPRPRFKKMQEFFIWSNADLVIRWRVDGVSGA